VGYEPYFYGWYQQGVSAYYDGDKFDFMASVVNSVFGGYSPLDSDSDPDVELGVAFSPSDSFTTKLFLIQENDDEEIDLWAMFTVGDLTLGAEYITRDYGIDSMSGFSNGDEGEGYLLMANYAPSDFGVTFRYGALEITDAMGVPYIDSNSITVAPSVTVGDNLLLVFEYRIDTDSSGPMDVDTNSAAVEFLFTF
jgi:hypothetical protein